MLRSLSGCGIRRPKRTKRMEERENISERQFYSLPKCLLGVLGYSSHILQYWVGNVVFC